MFSHLISLRRKGQNKLGILSDWHVKLSPCIHQELSSLFSFEKKTLTPKFFQQQKLSVVEIQSVVRAVTKQLCLGEFRGSVRVSQHVVSDDSESDYEKAKRR